MSRRDGSHELYVGYRPVPAGYRRFLRRSIPALLAGFLLVAGLTAWTQSDAGPGAWDSRTPRSFVGVLTARPSPMLWADDRGDGQPGFLLLVEPGKRGATRAEVLDGRRVEIFGTLLHRAGRRMLELQPGDPRPAAPAASAPPVPTAVERRVVTLRGEIVDSKCFLGAMKPGHGKTHKECATLCIAGGIPALFVTRDARGGETLYLIADESGGPVDRGILPFVADPVQATGELEQRGDLSVLRVSVAGIRRL